MAPIALSGAPPMHAPAERVSVAELTPWHVLVYDPAGARHAYLAERGFLHVQLCDPGAGLSLLTPSRFTNGAFEAWAHGQRLVSRDYAQVAAWLVARGSVAPGAATIEALIRWFVARDEPARIRLLRQVWRP